ncbi:alpha/beta fold hydrolase [Emticicia sp. CRIBPO]|uniref:alpha/beta fold hydrolase n=1 Tax=Emticicia sp. CRIBPO TaxID=2683258 RepID=UPI0014123CC3|nr:alpha/beta hydrolase [Emticicia sp. CRIBPO]NBA86298.1 alpha/beta fold hydrolase [Emticicia sp. CRIBPO]
MRTLLLIIALFVSLCITPLQAQTSFRVEVKGKGDPVLIFPGFGCPGEMWDETVSELSKTNECHVFTFAGFGGVPPVEKDWFLTIKNEITAYVKDRKLKNPALLGHSLGGTLSLWLVSSEPDLFKRAILVDALPASAQLMIPNYNGEKIAYENPQSKMMLNMDDASFRKMIDQSVKYMCSNVGKQKVIAEWMYKTDRKTYVYGYIDMLNLDLRKDLAKIRVPVYILAATLPSKEMVSKTYADQYKTLPAVKIRYADNASHFLMFDQPQWFVSNVKEILAQ